EVTRMSRLKLWTKEEIQYLKDNVNLLTKTEMAKVLNRTYKSIEKKMWEEGIKKSGNDWKKWTDKEREFIIKNAEFMTQKELAAHLKRTKSAVQYQIRLMRKKGVHIPKRKPKIKVP